MSIESEIKGFVFVGEYKIRGKTFLQKVVVFYDRDNHYFFGHYQNNKEINRFEAHGIEELEQELVGFKRSVSRREKGNKNSYSKFVQDTIERVDKVS